MSVVFQPAPAVSSETIRFKVEVRDWDAEGDRAFSLALFGWCLSATGKPVEIEIYVHGTLIASTPLTVDRPDVVTFLEQPDLPVRCGFHLRISKLAIPPCGVLELKLWQSKDGASSRVLLGTLSGVPAARLSMRYVEKYNPLLLLAMGRSGTTYLMQLLGAHPEILVPGPHPYEMRQPVWLWHAANVLAAPANIQSTQADSFETQNSMFVGSNPYRNRDWEKFSREQEAMQWQEDVLPLEIIEFCKRQADEFIDRCCSGRASIPRYIAQKMSISATGYFIENVYPGLRQIFLVRDFRDVWLSARSFNRRRGDLSFERNQFPDDISWMRGLAFSSHQVRMNHLAAGPRAQCVRYEDLMADPGATLQRLFERLGVAASADLVGSIVAGVAENNENTIAHRTSEPGGASGRWRAEMTAEEKQVAGEVFGEDLAYFGYEL